MLEVMTLSGHAPTLVFLHEGLGCVSMWKDFPAQLAAATGCAALVYSRAGYGQSDPISLPRPLDYMEREGVAELAQLLSDVPDAILIGHSDGGSIALAYAASHQGLRGVIVEAPHVFCEAQTVESIEQARLLYQQGELRRKLERHHGRNVDCAFWGWNGAWLHPDFRRWNIERFLPDIQVPVLVIQGRQDEYGTLGQVDAICRQVPHAESALLDRCGHSPHRDQPAQVLAIMSDFVRRLSSTAAVDAPHS
jgi:pimeloyl-ACP methyl ester carboxylesterase